MRFSAGLRMRYPSLGFNELEQRLGKARAVAVSVASADDVSPVAKIPFKVYSVLQTGLRRNLELADSFVFSMNGRLFVPLFVDSRAALETAGLLWDLSMRVESVLGKGEDAVGELDTHLMKVLLGGKSREWVGKPDELPAPNVLTILERLSNAGYPQLRGFYDMLCEFAHPNFSGMQGAYTQLDPTAREIRFLDRPFHQQASSLNIPIDALSIALEVTVMAVCSYDKSAPAFVRLCEQLIHKQGTWPASVPYPRT